MPPPSRRIPTARGRGVLIVMHGEIHSARRVTKIDTSDVDAFDLVLPPDLGTVRSGLVEFSETWSPHVHVPLPERVAAGRYRADVRRRGRLRAAGRCATWRGRAGHRRRRRGQRQRGPVRWNPGCAARRPAGGHLQPCALRRQPADLRLRWRRRRPPARRRDLRLRPQPAESPRAADGRPRRRLRPNPAPTPLRLRPSRCSTVFQTVPSPTLPLLPLSAAPTPTQPPDGRCGHDTSGTPPRRSAPPSTPVRPSSLLATAAASRPPARSRTACRCGSPSQW